MSQRLMDRQGVRGEMSPSVEDQVVTRQLILTIISARMENLILALQRGNKMVAT